MKNVMLWLVAITLLSSCMTTKVRIEIVETISKVDHFIYVASRDYQKRNAIPVLNMEEKIVFEIRTNRDLFSIVEKGNMRAANFYIVDCDGRIKNGPVYYSDYIYAVNSLDHQGKTFYAFVPIKYETVIDSWSIGWLYPTTEEGMRIDNSCFEIGAGSMAFTLRSNAVNFEWPDSWKDK